MRTQRFSRTCESGERRVWQRVKLTFGALITLIPFSVVAGPVSYDGGAGVMFDNFSLSTSIFVPANDNRILIVGFGSTSENHIDVVSTSMTFGGVEMTHLGGIVQNEFTDWYARTDIFYLLNPNPGTGALSGSVNTARPTGFRQETNWGMFGMALSNAAQEAPRLAFTKKQNPGAPSSTIGGDVGGVANDSMLVGFTAINAGINNLFSTSGVTEVYDAGFSDLNFGAGYKLVGGDPETFTWITNGFASGIGTVAIAEVSAFSPVPLPPTLPLLISALLSVAAIVRRKSTA